MHILKAQVLNKLTILATASYLASCTPGGSESVVGEMPYNVNSYKLNRLVCDPMSDGGPTANITSGLKAELFYLNPGQPRYSNLDDYFEHGQLSEQSIFFSRIHVQTRYFNEGFPTETGELITNDNNEVLEEHFALKMKTILKLGENDEAGVYEFAILSDDGTKMKVRNDQGVYETIINSDGNHATKMGCSTVKINMTKDTELPTIIEYFQGPRYRLAIVPLWRKVDENTAFDPLCSKGGVKFYFDSDNNSEPTSNYLALEARGWKPLQAVNYALPIQAAFNPCVSGEAPVITNVQVVEDSDRIGVVRVTWITDIPSTSQVRVVNQLTSQETLTDADNMLRLYHEVYVDSLQPNTPYLIQAVSISDTYGKTLSDVNMISVN